MALQSLKKLLQSKVASSPLGKDIERSQVITEANTILVQWYGKAILTKITSAYVKNKTLTFILTSAPLAQEIRLRKSELLNLLQNKTGGAIRDITTVV